MGPDVAAVRLRRGIVPRLASSSTQFVLTLLCGFAVFGFTYGAAHGRGFGPGGFLAWLGLLVLLVPWVVGLTAWARADDDGIRWRYWLRYAYAWHEIDRITLTKRIPLAQSTGSDREPVIVVHPRANGETFEVNVRPGDGTGRYLRRFAVELCELARQHDVRVVVASNGWDQPLPDGAEEEVWS